MIFEGIRPEKPVCKRTHINQKPVFVTARPPTVEFLTKRNESGLSIQAGKIFSMLWLFLCAFMAGIVLGTIIA